MHGFIMLSCCIIVFCVLLVTADSVPPNEQRKTPTKSRDQEGYSGEFCSMCVY